MGQRERGRDRGTEGVEGEGMSARRARGCRVYRVYYRSRRTQHQAMQKKLNHLNLEFKPLPLALMTATLADGTKKPKLLLLLY